MTCFLIGMAAGGLALAVALWIVWTMAVLDVRL